MSDLFTPPPITERLQRAAENAVTIVGLDLLDEARVTIERADREKAELTAQAVEFKLRLDRITALCATAELAAPDAFTAAVQTATLRILAKGGTL